MNRLATIIGVGVLATGASFALTSVYDTQAISAATRGPEAAQQQSAQDVYLDKCSVCHAKDGSGNTAKGKKLKVKAFKSPEVQKMTDAQIVDAIANGKGKDMDGFQKELGADTVKQLAAYCRTLAAQ